MYIYIYISIYICVSVCLYIYIYIYILTLPIYLQLITIALKSTTKVHSLQISAPISYVGIHVSVSLLYTNSFA